MQTKKKHCRKTNRGRTAIILIIAFVAILAVFASSQVILQKNQDDFLRNQYPLKYSEYVEKYSKEYGVSQSLIYAVIRTESKFKADAGSSAGALGLMQLIPQTFEWLQLRRDAVGDYVTDDLLEPEINIDYGTYFLSYLLEKYESEESAVAAYNAGFGAVDEWLQDPEKSSDGINLDYIPYDETREYVKRVSEAKAMYEELYDL